MRDHVVGLAVALALLAPQVREVHPKWGRLMCLLFVNVCIAVLSVLLVVALVVDWLAVRRMWRRLTAFATGRRAR